MNLKIEILRLLDSTQGKLYREDTLLNELRTVVPNPPTTTEFAAVIRELSDRRLITGVHPELGGPVKWQITDKGKASLNGAI